MSSSYASPAGPPPPTSPSTRPTPQNPPRRQSTFDVDAIPDDAPPAYDAIANDTTMESGPTRIDFSGPPPMSDRMQQRMNNMNTGSTLMTSTPTGGQGVPGVGYGYGPTRPPQQQPWGQPQPQPMSGGWTPPPPPRHPAVSSPTTPVQTGGYPGSRFNNTPPLTPSSHTGTPPLASPAAPADGDATPTEAPMAGRPLLRNGQLLVYPKGHYCSKCGNTGYKGANPREPCSSDWRKYGKEYNSALAHSYSVAAKPGANATTSAASNFQRPLPAQQARPVPSLVSQQHAQQPYYGGRPQGQYPHLPPPPVVHQTYYGQAAPPGALVLRPGDPRIGGKLCYRCGGSGQEDYLFYRETCGACRGTGRVF